MPERTRTIVFVSDFGYRNEWVGICHAVMNRIAPASPVVDLSHGVPPLDVRNGALLLADALPYLSPDAVLLAVVDPSVGRDRDVALETSDGRFLVGPDNGLLAPASAALGGVRRAVEITSGEIVLTPISPSFHARDVLAPAAAHLARSDPLDALGPTLDPATLADLAFREPLVERGKIECEVLDLNRVGNVMLNVRESHVAESGLATADAVQIDATSGSARARWVSTYADLAPGDWGIILDPRGWLLVIRGNPANAAEGLGSVGSGDPIWLTATRD
ncbi:MAG: S-adenosyl-l-methionine hydroxide adenosyltransferase family protein [Rhodospirillaceae bacterium]